MAQKVLENTIREMTRVISDLNDKIGVIDSKLDQQSVIISKQSEVIDQLRKELEGTKQQCKLRTSPTTVAGAPDNSALQQRPLRQARLKALAAVGNASAKGDYAAATKRSSAVGSRASTANTPETSRNLPRRSAVAVKGDPPVAPPTIVSAEPCVVTNSATTDAESRNDSGEWKEIRRRFKNRPSRTVLIGTGNGNNELQAAERLKHINAWSFRPQTTEQDVLNHINKIAQSDKYKVEKRQISSEDHAAFIVSFPESLYDTLCSPASWPPRVKICDWFLARPRRERGAGHNTVVAVVERSRSDHTEREVAS